MVPIDDHGIPDPKKHGCPEELGHTWTNPTEVLQKIETLEMCFSRSGPPDGVINALKSVGTEIKKKKYLGFRKKLTDEIGNIDSIKSTKGMFGTLFQNFLLSFFVGVFTLCANLAYEKIIEEVREVSNFNSTDGSDAIFGIFEGSLGVENTGLGGN